MLSREQGEERNEEDDYTTGLIGKQQVIPDPVERKTYVAKEPGKDVREAILDYETLASAKGMSLMKIQLRTGRTHQIRAQFSSRALPLVGDKKYSRYPDECPIALWSHRIAFDHPETGERMEFSHNPPEIFPWTEFGEELKIEN